MKSIVLALTSSHSSSSPGVKSKQSNVTCLDLIQPRLQGALPLKQKGPLKGVNGNRGSSRDVNRSGDAKSEEEKYFLSAMVKFSKKREKISPGAEGGPNF